MLHKVDDKRTAATRQVLFKCPHCGDVHGVTDWHKASLRRWKTIRRLPANKHNCWYECPKCGRASKGIDMIPVIKLAGNVTTAEGWFEYYHYTD